MTNWIRTYSTSPPVGAFGDTSGQGTPIVIDESADTAYYLKNNVPTPISGGGSTSPGAPNLSVQVNVGSVFTGSAAFLYDDVTETMSIGSIASGMGYVTGRDASIADDDGADITVRGGTGDGTGSGGDGYLMGGDGGAGGGGGSAIVQGGTGYDDSAGPAFINGGSAIGSGDVLGARVDIQGGNGTGTRAGGDVIMSGGIGTDSDIRGNVVANGTGTELLADAVGGFFTIPFMSESPTGVPEEVRAGNVVGPVYDKDTDRIWFHNGTSWKYLQCL